ncbi:MAG: membrane-bound lytic murein transglycosylase MltF [Deltaproteobacteria bacterium]|nr:membrane-bound lytic murein transglycosylase MltF [Deltaproteobacteria bacterium]
MENSEDLKPESPKHPSRHFRLTALLFLGLLISLATYYYLTNYRFQPLTLKPGTLTVLTQNIPTAYYHGPEGEMGFEYDLALAFAKELGLKLEIKVVDTISEMMEEIAENRADIAAGGLTRTPAREKRFIFGPDYFTVRQELVYRKNGPHPRDLEDLKNFDFVVLARSSYEERLRELRLKWPELKWQTTADYSTDQLLEKVWLKELPCTVADSNILAANLRHYPELKIAFSISKEQPLAWPLNKNRRKLQKKLLEWFAIFSKEGHLETLTERYYGHVEIFDYVDIKIFLRRVKTLLPTYRPLFEKYAKKFNIPWTLLAAKAYQESHWNPLAKSPTGVRGIMMLTRTTAEQMGIKNRLNVSESIRGGAQYFRRLLDRVPDSYPEKDRRNVAIAAYNVGMGHIHDARQLAQLLGHNPDLWSTLKETLPLLSQKKYYKDLKHGYARGYEPVRYVERINNYRDILEKKLKPLNENYLLNVPLRISHTGEL